MQFHLHSNLKATSPCNGCLSKLHPRLLHIRVWLSGDYEKYHTPGTRDPERLRRQQTQSSSLYLLIEGQDNINDFSLQTGTRLVASVHIDVGFPLDYIIIVLSATKL